MIAHLNVGDTELNASERLRWFCAAGIFTHGLLAFSYLRVMWYLNEARNLGFLTMFRFAIDILLLLSIVLGWEPVPYWNSLALWLLGLIPHVMVLFVVWSMSELDRHLIKVSFFLLLHLDHCADGLGGFTIIVLGVSLGNIRSVSQRIAVPFTRHSCISRSA